MSRWKPELGAIVRGEATSFCVWAPKPREVQLQVEQGGVTRRLEMSQDNDGYWTASVEGFGPGARYGFVLDGEGPFPDPCSRSQPAGVHALSEAVDPGLFAWTDAVWAPPPYRDLVIYECHVGTFTAAGTFDAVIERLPYLRDLGVNALELMPVAAFPGRWNWGYDGVSLFAPAAVYGGPEGLRRLVDAAHASGMAIILDVVYNHFGPDGNYTGAYSESYVNPSEETPWGPAMNFGGEHSAHVRRFYRENLLHWLHEYHIDGFRFDATHAIIDRGPAHILAELSAAVEAHPRIAERPYLIAESHENDVRYLRPRDEGGFAFDGVWTDDFHHAMRTLLARDREGYYADFPGTLDDLAATISRGFLFEGDRKSAILGMRGTRARDVPWGSFVYCLQNHDQVGNRAFGDRLSATASHADFRAASMLLLLLPQAPLLFQGQEFLAATPFQYFTDHDVELGRAVTEGRRREFAAWGAFSDAALREAIPDPQDPRTFQRSKLNWDEARAGVGRLALDYHRELLRLRREDPVLAAYRAERLSLDARVRGRVLVVALEHGGARRWIVVNFGEDVEVPIAEAVGAEVIASSDDPRWGGMGWRVTVGQATSLPAHSGAFLGLR